MFVIVTQLKRKKSHLFIIALQNIQNQFNKHNINIQKLNVTSIVIDLLYANQVYQFYKTNGYNLYQLINKYILDKAKSQWIPKVSVDFFITMNIQYYYSNTKLKKIWLMVFHKIHYMNHTNNASIDYLATFAVQNFRIFQIHIVYNASIAMVQQSCPL